LAFIKQEDDKKQIDSSLIKTCNTSTARQNKQQRANHESFVWAFYRQDYNEQIQKKEEKKKKRVQFSLGYSRDWLFLWQGFQMTG
jgi:hypothetical protein